MRSLSIGNSFSQDAYGYLHQIAASLGIEWECVNLYIGGCSLQYHAENLREIARVVIACFIRDISYGNIGFYEK